MKTFDYQKSITIKTTTEKVFSVLTSQIQEWWTKDFEGSSKNEGDEFSVHFGETFKTMQILEIIPNEKVTWLCIDQHLEMPLGIPALKNKKEWVGNKIRWRIDEIGETTQLQLTHEGLNPTVECWDVCEQGWDQSLQSLKQLLEKSSGLPFQQLDIEHLNNAIENKWKSGNIQ